MELAGERYPASHFTVVVGFQDKMCIRKKKTSNKKAKSTNKQQQHWARNCQKSWNVIGFSHTKYYT